jgi:hypothetical protein
MEAVIFTIIIRTESIIAGIIAMLISKQEKLPLKKYP